MPATIPPIAVCGLGRVGTHLASALLDADLPLRALATSNPTHAQRITKHATSITIHAQAEDLLDEAELIVLAMPDRMLSMIAEKIAQRDEALEGKTFVHCAGSLLASELSALEKAGAQVAVFHPLQALSAKDQFPLSPFHGIGVGIESKQPEILHTIARKLGATPFDLPSDPDARKRYHLAAVLASNALVPLIDAAAKIMHTSGVSESPQALLLPLIKGTLDNLSHTSAGEALTGPVARGDVTTLQAHLDQLKNLPELHDVYRQTMLEAARLAREAQRIDQQSFDAINQLLGGAADDS